MEQKHHPKEHAQSQRLAFGIVLIGLGGAILMKNLGLMPEFIRDLVFSWPMLLVAIGIITVGGKNKLLGIILIVTGAAFMVPIAFDLTYNFRKVFWPVVLVIIGLSLVFKNWENFFRPRTEFSESDEYIDETAVFGGGERIIHSQNLKGGRITAIFGGSKLDLTQAELSDGENILDISCVFGGFTLIVPKHWEIKSQITSVFGGFSDKRVRREELPQANKKLVIKGTAVFGGGEIKSY